MCIRDSYGRVFAGRHRSDEYLMGSSSGGLCSWLVDQLMARGLVDGVIHVGRAGGEGQIFAYAASLDRRDARARRKSQYCATTLADVLTSVRADDRRFAIVGVPCFIKATRALCRDDPLLADRLPFFIGLVCGHLKSQFFAESLAWQLGVVPDELEAVDFRIKNATRSSSDYDFGALRRGEDEFVQRRARDLIGTNWGHGAFQLEACNFCDDVLAETADVVFGDAWLPQYTQDWRGTNVVVTRNSQVDAIFADGVAAGEIWLEDLTVDEVARSQAGNYRHRRDGLSVRLADDIAARLSVPSKRVEPRVDHVSARRRRLIRLRRRMSAASHELFAQAREEGELPIYLDAMRRSAVEYRRTEVPLWRRMAGRVRRLVRRILRPSQT